MITGFSAVTSIFAAQDHDVGRGEGRKVESPLKTTEVNPCSVPGSGIQRIVKTLTNPELISGGAADQPYVSG